MRRLTTMMFILSAAVLLSLNGCKKAEDNSASPPPAQQSTSTPAAPAPSSSTPPATTPASKPQVKAKLPGGPLLSGQPLEIGYILWGGEFAAFYGNGGLQTRQGTIFADHGLNVKFVAEKGDDFNLQLAKYKAGKRHVLRGTYTMIAKHAQDLCQNPDLCPEVFVVMTRSKGDHLICRTASVKTADQLKGKTVAMQRNGPHEKLLWAALQDGGLKWSDVKIEWMTNITGPGSPPVMFRQNNKIDCTLAVTPDMLGITGGHTVIGNGAEGTIPDTKVIVSTAFRDNTIVDVYAVSAKYARENPNFTTNFSAAYLKSVEAVIALRKAYESGGSTEMSGLLQWTVQNWTTEVLPNETEAFGLYTDAGFLGHAGNVRFFNPGNEEGFRKFSAEAAEVAIALGTATDRTGLKSSQIDWTHSVFSGLKSKGVSAAPRMRVEATEAEIKALNESGMLGDRATVRSFVYFDINETAFDPTKYTTEFDRVLKLVKSYRKAPIVIRGHMDTIIILSEAIRDGVRKGHIQQNGNTKGNYTYSVDGELVTLDNIQPWLALLKQRGYTHTKTGKPLEELVTHADKVSKERAKQVKDALMKYATDKGQPLDTSQIKISGAGVREPFIVKPRSPEQSAKNRRVEFSVVPVSLEAGSSADYDL